jgi:hypothetical protein
MFKKICVSVVAIMVLALASTVLFAQSGTLTDDSVKTFITVYADPTPEAVGKASADLGVAGAQELGIVAGKITTIYQMKFAGVDGDALKAQVAGMPAPMTITAEEVDVYNAHEGDLKVIVEKLLTPAN